MSVCGPCKKGREGGRMAAPVGGVTEMMRGPTAEEISASEFSQVQRMDVDCNLSNERFVTMKNDMAAQYADLYFVRLSLLKKDVIEASSKLWPDVPLCDRILEAQTGLRSVLVGTIYKDMKLKPNILKKYSGEEQDTPDISAEGLVGDNLVSDSDYVVIEDESGRLTLIMEGKDCPKSSDLVTGIIIGVIGHLSEEGSFIVESVSYPGIPPQAPPAAAPAGAQLLIVSGLGLGGEESASLSAELLVDYVTGSLGGGVDHGEAAKIIRVIVAGNSCAQQGPTGERLKGAAACSHPVRDLDMLLTRLCASVPVDLMPGETDPSGVFLPQQPFHRCLLPSANTYSTFRSVTNPYAFHAGANGTDAGPSVMGTSGQNVTDVLRYSTVESPLDVLELMLKWRHLAPTAPDTLSCFPLAGIDPFILETCPSVLFTGNQDRFASRVVDSPAGQKCLILSLPAFSKAGSAALVNLGTLECSEICFDVASIASSQ